MAPAASTHFSSAAEKVTPSAGNQQATAAGVNNEFEPPLACIRRILKNSLPKSTNVGKDASMAFSRACGIFCIYLATCANDFARESKRQTITANDILAAIKELDFDEFTPQLEQFLQEHRKDEKRKKDAKAKAATEKDLVKGETKEGAMKEDEDCNETRDIDEDEDETEEDGKPSALDTTVEYGDDDDEVMRNDGEDEGHANEEDDEGDENIEED